MLELNIDLTGVSTTRPVAVAGKYAHTIKTVEVVDGREAGKHNLLVVFLIAEDATSTFLAGKGTGEEGDIKAGGLETRKYFPLQPTDKPGSTFDFKKDLCRLVNSALGYEEGQTPALTGELLAQLPAKEVFLSLKVEESDDFGPQNSVGIISAMPV